MGFDEDKVNYRAGLGYNNKGLDVNTDYNSSGRLNANVNYDSPVGLNAGFKYSNNKGEKTYSGNLGYSSEKIPVGLNTGYTHTSEGHNANADLNFNTKNINGNFGYEYNQGNNNHSFNAGVNIPFLSGMGNVDINSNYNLGDKQPSVNVGGTFKFENGGFFPIMKDGGQYLTVDGEYHRVYRNAEGDIMVNHPKEDKGKWDTINLTDKSDANTIAEGVASVKKWHKENPYAFGGNVMLERYEAGGELIKRADGSYSRRGLWDNIRENAGSGKKPTKEMLKQEKKIKASEKKANGGSVWEILEETPIMQTGGRAPLEISDPRKFKIRQQAYNDSLNLFLSSEKQKKELRSSGYNPLGNTPWSGGIASHPTIKPVQEEAWGKNGITSTWIDVYKKPVQPVVYKPTILDATLPASISTVTPSTTSTYESLEPLRPKQTSIELPQLNTQISQEQQQLEFNNIPFKKGSYFTVDREGQQSGGAGFSDRRTQMTDYYDNKTGKKLGAYPKKELGGNIETESEWEILDKAKDGKLVKSFTNVNNISKNKKPDAYKKLSMELYKFEDNLQNKYSDQAEKFKNKYYPEDYDETTGHNDYVDALRHAGTAMYTTSGQGDILAPLKIPYTNVMGAAHELMGLKDYVAKNNKLTWKGVKKQLKETGSDLYNNFVGSMIGGLPTNIENKEKVLKAAKDYGVLSDLSEKKNGGNIQTENEWEIIEDSDEMSEYKNGGKTPAWQRKEGKSPTGGLNAKGRASLKAEGHDIKPPQPQGGARKKSFCARMKGMKKKNTSAKTANDPNSRINLSLKKWKC